MAESGWQCINIFFLHSLSLSPTEKDLVHTIFASNFFFYSSPLARVFVSSMRLKASSVWVIRSTNTFNMITLSLIFGLVLCSAALLFFQFVQHKQFTFNYFHSSSHNQWICITFVSLNIICQGKEKKRPRNTLIKFVFSWASKWVEVFRHFTCGIKACVGVINSREIILWIHVITFAQTILISVGTQQQ